MEELDPVVSPAPLPTEAPMEETVEIVEVPAERPFMTTPLNDYTVTEGLLLVLVLLLLLGFVYKLWKEVF